MLACQGIGLEKEFGGDVEAAAEAFDVVLVKFAPRRACGAQKSRLPLRTSETMLGAAQSTTEESRTKQREIPRGADRLFHRSEKADNNRPAPLEMTVRRAEAR